MARILIADDDPRAREILRRICEHRGHEVEEAPDGARALAEYQRFQPELLIVDLAMPLGGGQQLVESIRAENPGGICPVIVVSGYSAVLGEGERDALGAYAIIEKPVQLQMMLDALDGALAQPTHE